MIHQLQNTLYIQVQGAYLRLDHETVRIEAEGSELMQIPLHHLGAIAVFGNVLLSPFLIHKCGHEQRSLTWFSQAGRFQGRLHGPTSGNVLLRLAQFEAHRDPMEATRMARAFVSAKLRNARSTLQRAIRDGGEASGLHEAVKFLERLQEDVAATRDVDALRGIEGVAAASYFEVFGSMLRNSELQFSGRNRRPPRDPVNAALSFAYALLANECASACEGVGLDPQVGFLHALRSGRASLALDIMEEMRAPIADRAVLTLLNRRQLTASHFSETPGGGVHLTEDGRREFLKHWQARKQEEVEHAALGTRVPIGLIPHVQARLLARTLRGDLAEYPPYAPRG